MYQPNEKLHFSVAMLRIKLQLNVHSLAFFSHKISHKRKYLTKPTKYFPMTNLHCSSISLFLTGSEFQTVIINTSYFL